jgi:hypothetical protein
MHINPALKTKALVMLYNPLKQTITRIIKLPLYYTGSKGEVLIRERSNKAARKTLARDYSIDLSFTIGPEAYTWITIE